MNSFLSLFAHDGNFGQGFPTSTSRDSVLGSRYYSVDYRYPTLQFTATGYGLLP